MMDENPYGVEVIEPPPRLFKVRRQRCGTCENCLRADCGKCRYCLRKTKFGGSGHCKNACMLRKCNFMRECIINASSQQTTARRKRSNSGGDCNVGKKMVVVEEEVPREENVMGYAYGKPVLRNNGVCAGCRGGRDHEAAEEPVLLCDGEGCFREYHIGCVDPPLSEIPEGDFFCSDCDAYGSSADLYRYFENCDEERGAFATSREYVEHLVQKSMETVMEQRREQAQEDTEVVSVMRDEDKDKSKKRKDRSAEKKPVPPRSELFDIKKLHYAAMADPKDACKKAEDVRHDLPSEEPYEASWLVGKPIRLYCPEDNSYHVGRIIDWRKATNILPPFVNNESEDDASQENSTNTTPEPKSLFYGQGEIASCEFLIRFLPGINNRKKLLHRWLILEEHSLVLGTTLIWGHLGKFRGMGGWKPAQILLRSALELVPVTDFSTPKPNDVSTALALFYGDETQTALLQEDEMCDINSPPHPNVAAVASVPLATPSPSAHSHPLATNWVKTCGYAMAMIELEERERVKYWHRLELRNGGHERALRLVDEFTFPALEMKREDAVKKEEDKDDTNENASSKLSQKQKGPKLCPLIPHGLDRVYLSSLPMITPDGDKSIARMEQSLDANYSMSVRPVQCMPSAVASLQRALRSCGTVSFPGGV